MTPEELAEKTRIATNWLPRYTGMPLDKFGKYILLTNFKGYVEEFAKSCNMSRTHGSPMSAITSNDGSIIMINFGIGAPNAVLICDLLAVIKPEAVLFLGKCGGLEDGSRKISIGDYILPTAAIRGEGTSAHYFPQEVPALPTFQIQKEASRFVVKHGMEYHSGTVYTTNRRLWEHDEEFRNYLRRLRCIGIEMETAAFFIASFANHIPHGALLLVSDMPLVEAKTAESDRKVSATSVYWHVHIGVETLQHIRDSGEPVRYLVY